MLFFFMLKSIKLTNGNFGMKQNIVILKLVISNNSLLIEDTSKKMQQ